MIKYSQNFYESVSNRGISSAEIASDVLIGAIEPRSVIDIGSGEGLWLNRFSKKFDTAARLVALDLQNHDSQFFDELAHSGKNFQFIEVNFENSSEIPAENFDLAICLEVFEHLSKDTATQVAKEMGEKCAVVIFSAAIRGQGGTGHINEQSFDYWMRLMRKQGFVILDVFRPALSKSREVPGYYKQNMVLLWHPDNSKKNSVKFDLHRLLTSNELEVQDIRKNFTKVKFGVIGLLPAGIVTVIVRILDKTIRKLTQ